MRFLLFPASVAFLLLAACSVAEAPPPPDDADALQLSGDQTSQPAPADLQATNPASTDEQWFANGAISGTEELPASGVAQTRLLADGSFVVSMQVNLPMGEEGTFYVGWLVDAAGDAVRLPVFSSPFGDERHMLEYRVTRDLRSHLDVLVTRENRRNPSSPGTVVATGTVRAI